MNEQLNMSKKTNRNSKTENTLVTPKAADCGAHHYEQLLRMTVRVYHVYLRFSRRPRYRHFTSVFCSYVIFTALQVRRPPPNAQKKLRQCIHRSSLLCNSPLRSDKHPIIDDHTFALGINYRKVRRSALSVIGSLLKFIAILLVTTVYYI